jgi:hypothetical protein
MIVEIGEDERDRTLRYRGNRDGSRNDDRRISGERSNRISLTSLLEPADVRRVRESSEV